MIAVFNPTERRLKDEILDELEDLAETLGYIVVDKIIQNLDKPDNRRYFGKGKLEQVKKIVSFKNISVVITRHNLTPSQKKNLESFLEVKVLDRTQVILEIFKKHAVTREGKLEVELARLKYELPSLKGKGTSLSNTGAGIGTRGPGEKILERDRRLALKRITVLQKELIKQRKVREVIRKKRQRNSIPVVSFVGYTNVGKSSLISALTGADLLVENQLFSTLDVKTCRLKLPSGRRVLISDTVGFIRELPQELIQSFKSTLEEAKFSDLLVVVLDASDRYLDEKLEIINSTLRDIGAENVPKLNVINKIDKCTGERLKELGNSFPNAVFVSAVLKYNLDELKEKIDIVLSQSFRKYKLVVPPEKLGEFLKVRDEIKVISQECYGDSLIVVYKAPERIHKKLVSFIGEGVK
ncbi:GTP-binding protein HflX [Kosmotoga sp. DU53]|nr:GTP-binding protein HflX [Kosmotoga sp. DU53]